MKKSILAVAVALAASLLHADLLYWQVSDQVGPDFNYAQLYYTTGEATTAGGGTPILTGGTSSSVMAPQMADITGINNISGFYVDFFSGSTEAGYDSLGVSNWLSYNDVLSAMYRFGEGGKDVQIATSVATFVPEPTSGLLLLLGLAGLAVRRKRG